MPWPEDPASGAPHWAGVNVDLSRLVAAAADLCRKPLRHAVVPLEPDQGPDRTLRLEVRTAAGERQLEEDLELEIYRSGDDLNLTLAWVSGDDRPMLWHGNHPVWMDAGTGQRCERPSDGMPLEALARRVRALLSPDR